MEAVFCFSLYLLLNLKPVSDDVSVCDAEALISYMSTFIRSYTDMLTLTAPTCSCQTDLISSSWTIMTRLIKTSSLGNDCWRLGDLKTNRLKNIMWHCRCVSDAQGDIFLLFYPPLLLAFVSIHVSRYRNHHVMLLLKCSAFTVALVSISATQKLNISNFLWPIFLVQGRHLKSFVLVPL